MAISDVGILLVLCIVVVESQTTPRCLRSRELCKPNVEPSPDEYCVLNTKIRRTDCRERGGVCGIPIPNLGTNEMRVLFSPGFESDREYPPNMLVKYKVQCNENELAYYNTTFLDTQEREDCQHNGYHWCQDYLRIIRSTFGVSESCGNNSSRPSHLQLADPEFTVVFRTSEDLRVGKGFQMYVTCFNPEENDAEDCVEATAFTTALFAMQQSERDITCACRRRRNGITQYLPNEAQQRELVSMVTPLLRFAAENSPDFMSLNETEYVVLLKTWMNHHVYYDNLGQSPLMEMIQMPFCCTEG